MKKPFTLLLWLSGCALFMAGCSSYDRNVISVGLSVELTGIERAADGTVAVNWNLMNPNVSPYLTAHLTNTIYLDGTLVGTTSINTPTAFPAGQATGQVTPLTLAGPAAERILAAAAARGQAAYKVDTEMLFRLYGDMTEKGNLTHSGSVPVTGK